MPDRLGRLAPLVVLERLAGFLEPAEVRRLAASCARLRRLLRAGVGPELLARQMLRRQLMGVKARLVDRVRVVIREKAPEAVLPAPAQDAQRGAELAQQLLDQKTLARAVAAQHAHELATKNAEIEELRAALETQQQHARVLALELLLLREELAAARTTESRYLHCLTEINRALP